MIELLDSLALLSFRDSERITTLEYRIVREATRIDALEREQKDHCADLAAANRRLETLEADQLGSPYEPRYEPGSLTNAYKPDPAEAHCGDGFEPSAKEPLWRRIYDWLALNKKLT